RDPVHPRRDLRIVLLRRRRGPVLRHPLIGDSPEQQRVHLVELAHRKFAELLIGDQPVELPTWALVVPVEGRRDEREDLPHRELLMVATGSQPCRPEGRTKLIARWVLRVDGSRRARTGSAPVPPSARFTIKTEWGSTTNAMSPPSR